MTELSRLTGTQRAYYGAFALSVVLCWSPWKALAYFAPVLAVLWFIWVSCSRVARRRALWWSFGWLGLVSVYWAFRRGFDLAPALLAFLTYGTLGVLCVIPTKGLGGGRLLGRMVRLVVWVMVLEAVFGIGQAVINAVQRGTFDWSNGDAVQGTIYPGIHSSLSFANSMFAVNMAFMLIALLPASAIGKRWRGTVLLGLVAFVLASVMHAIFFLAVAFGAGYVLCRPRLRLVKGKTFLVSTLCALPVLTYFFLSANVLTLAPIARQALAGATPRAIVVLDSVTRLPRQYPLMPFIGLGPGQFSSRAALMVSGTYLDSGEKSLPLIHPQSSPAFRKYLAPLVAQARDPAFGGSTTVKPFFSWLSVYTEFGFPCLIGIFSWVAVILRRVRREALKKNERLLGAAVVAGIVFFVLLGLQVDYWEVPQAILIGALLTKAMYATLMGSTAIPRVSASRKGLTGDPQPA